MLNKVNLINFNKLVNLIPAGSQ